jgi:alginate O-acetyltransferase complex protein AlgI
LLFPTIDFAIFFGVVFLGNWLLAPTPRRWKLFIIAASYVFYAWWDWRFTFLLAAVTLLSVCGAITIASLESAQRRKVALVVTVAAEVGLLAWFKYYEFAAVTIDNAFHSLGIHAAPAPLLAITLPVGISFFTFMGLSYVIDVYRGNLTPASLIDVAVYLSFFPHLIAGPIVRGSELLPQIARSRFRDPRRVEFPEAAYLIFGGLFKKVVISSYVSSAIVDPVFNNPGVHSAPEILLAVYGYAVQIYCDFSGYTGFRFPQNFDRPYTARTLQEFWRRWHMTLSSWLRDYVYIPLGGNRGSGAKTYRNIMITMLLGGLWHGAAWTFVAWGGLHGAAQVLGHLRRERRVANGLPAEAGGRARVAWERLVTFHVVCLGWLFFRADSFHSAFVMLGRLFSTWGEPAPLFRLPVLAAIVGAIALQYVPPGFGARVQESFASLGVIAKGALLGGSLLVITTLGPPGVAPFIYYKF